MRVRVSRLVPVLVGLLCSFAFAGGLSYATIAPAHASEPLSLLSPGPAVDDVDDIADPPPVAEEPAPTPATPTPAPGLLGLAVEHGGDVLGWAFALFATAGSYLLTALGLSLRARSVFAELGAYARRAVLTTWQVYVKDIKAARADGKLTDAEKAVAKRHAIEQLREMLGWWKIAALGGGVLARIFPGSSWAARLETVLGSAVETAVAEAKQAGKAAGQGTKGTRAAPLSDGSMVDSVGLPLRAPKEPPPLPR